jgi:hypothetical protein
MPSDDLDDLTVVPLPGSETEEERERIRTSNARDQQLERDGRESAHNRGYDQVADLTPAPDAERQADE